MTAPRRALFALLSMAAAGVALAQPAQDLPISAKAATDFTALRQRPLFAPDRSVPPPIAPVEAAPVVEAPPPPPPPPPPAATAPDWELVGLVRSDRINSAMFRSRGTPPEFSLRQGESRDGWTLTDIGRSEVTLDSGQGRASLKFATAK